MDLTQKQKEQIKSDEYKFKAAFGSESFSLIDAIRKGKIAIIGENEQTQELIYRINPMVKGTSKLNHVFHPMDYHLIANEICYW